MRAVNDHPIPDAPLSWLAVFDSSAYDFVAAKNSKWHPGGLIERGDGLCCGKSSSSSNMLSFVGGLVTVFVDTVGDRVNSAAAPWESVKKAVLNIAAGVISAVGVPCDATCKALLTTGHNIAMAAAGIPPSLPNMDQLEQQGIAYVAAQVADQSPIPGTGVLAEKALAYAVKSIEDYTEQGGGSGLPDWLTMDTGFEPAIYTMRLDPLQPAHPPGSPDLITIPAVLAPNLAKVPPLPGASRTHNDYWQAGLVSDPCFALMEDWMVLPPTQSSVTFKFLGLQATRVYSIPDFDAPLPDPAIRNHCGL